MFTKNYFSMFHVTFVVLILSFFVALNAHAAAWFAKGPVGGNVRSIAIDPKVPSTLYAGTPAGVYKSTDAGATWTAVNEGLMVLPAEEGRIEFVDVTAGLAIDPSNPTRLYVLEDDNLYVTTNGGRSWSIIGDLDSVLHDKDAASLEIDPLSPMTLYVTAERGGPPIKSTNGGVTWTLLPRGGPDGLPIGEINGILADPANAGVLYADTEAGVYKSTEGGVTWFPVNNGLTNFPLEALTLAPSNSAILYAVTQGGLFKSVNGGGSWTFIASEPIDDNIQSFKVAPNDPMILYLGYEISGLFRSTNGGVAWLPVGDTTTFFSINTIVFDPVTPSKVYAGATNGLFKSINNGITWSDSSRGIQAHEIHNIKFDPADSKVMYATEENCGIYKTTNGGNAWVSRNRGLKTLDIGGLTIDPADSSVLYAGDRDGNIYKSIDSADIWSRSLVFELPPGIAGIYVDPVSPTTVYARTECGLFNGVFSSMFKSVDGGGTWSNANNGITDPDCRVTAFTLSPSNPSTLYAGTHGGGLFKSTNGAASWNLSYQFVDGDDAGVVVDPLSGETVYVSAYEEGLFKSTDGGATFSHIGFGVPGSVLNVLTIDPSGRTYPASLYAGTADGRVLVSSDGGKNWESRSCGLPGTEIDSLAVDPRNPSRLVAGTTTGVYEFDADRNLPGDLTGDCCVDRQDYNILIADVRSGPRTDPTHDLNSDGTINLADVRTLVALFTNPQGAPCQ